MLNANPALAQPSPSTTTQSWTSPFARRQRNPQRQLYPDWSSTSAAIQTSMLVMGCVLSVRFMMPAMTLLGPSS